MTLVDTLLAWRSAPRDLTVVELRKVCALKHWALEDRDDDVLGVCNRALAGDNTAAAEALEWFGAWAEMHAGDGKPS